MPSFPRQNALDLFLVAALFSLSFAATWGFHLSPLASWVLYYLPAIVLLFLRDRRKDIKRILSATLVFGIFIGIALDFLGTYNRLWSLDILTVPARLFGILPVDDLAWWILSTAFMFTFYEHFISGRVPKKT